MEQSKQSSPNYRLRRKCWLFLLPDIFKVCLFVFYKWWKTVSHVMQGVKVLSLTCTFLQATRPFSVHPELTVEVVLPELSKPDIPSVVGQRAATEIPIKCCKNREGKGLHILGVKGFLFFLCESVQSTKRLNQHHSDYNSLVSTERTCIYSENWDVHGCVICFDPQRAHVIHSLWILSMTEKLFLRSHPV